ncbi:MAG: SRPBCC family protein [Xanthobacteraceae bacterium]
MTATITIAPVRKSIRVNASQAHAFDVFTSGLGRWWPRNMGIGRMPMKAAVMETRLGGRWYELAEDGSQATVGKIIVWEPPQRFVMTWEINSEWKPDSTVSSEVEVRFIADGANTTRVEVEHRKFEQMGAEGGASMRKDVDGGWPGLLERFKTEAEAA